MIPNILAFGVTISGNLTFFCEWVARLSRMAPSDAERCGKYRLGNDFPEDFDGWIGKMPGRASRGESRFVPNSTFAAGRPVVRANRATIGRAQPDGRGQQATGDGR